MRTPALAAIVKGPFLKVDIRPSFERVPSGKVTIELPACRDSTVFLKVSSCDLRLSRRSAMCRANSIAQPMSGMRRISILDPLLLLEGADDLLHLSPFQACKDP